jgi:hypothetical protein
MGKTVLFLLLLFANSFLFSQDIKEEIVQIEKFWYGGGIEPPAFRFILKKGKSIIVAAGEYEQMGNMNGTIIGKNILQQYMYSKNGDYFMKPKYELAQFQVLFSVHTLSGGYKIKELISIEYLGNPTGIDKVFAELDRDGMYYGSYCEDLNNDGNNEYIIEIGNIIWVYSTNPLRRIINVLSYILKNI